MANPSVWMARFVCNLVNLADSISSDAAPLAQRQHASRNVLNLLNMNGVGSC